MGHGPSSPRGRSTGGAARPVCRDALTQTSIDGGGAPGAAAAGQAKAAPMRYWGEKEVEQWFATLPQPLQQHKACLLPATGKQVARWTDKGLAASGVVDGEAVLQLLKCRNQALPLSVPTRPVEQRGITLHYLRAFVTHAMQRDPDMTVAQAVEQVVRADTAEKRCAYFDIVPVAETGTPTFFISHTWSRKLRELLGALDLYFDTSNARDVVVWLDIMAINQHPYVEEKGLLEDDVARLEDVIRAVDKTLFMLDAEGVALTRVWCLFEVWTSLQVRGASGLEVLATAVDPDAWMDKYDELDITSAQATAPGDAETLCKVAGAQSSGGLEAVNSAVVEALGQCATSQQNSQRQRHLSPLFSYTNSVLLLVTGQLELAESELANAMRLLSNDERHGPESPVLQEAASVLVHVKTLRGVDEEQAYQQVQQEFAAMSIMGGIFSKGGPRMMLSCIVQQPKLPRWVRS